MTSPDPYTPPEPQVGEVVSGPVARPSTWMRNFKALTVVAVSYSLFCVQFALASGAMPEDLLPALLVLASIASAWANVPLGPQIGWDRGGLPVVVALFFLGVTSYCLAALLVSGLANGVINLVMVDAPHGSY